ncbi:unnamed protein product, partial [Ixodes pacificus]
LHDRRETLLAQSTGIVDVVGHFDNIVCQGDDEASAGAKCGGVHRQEPRTSRDEEQLTDSSKRTSPAAIDASNLRVWRHPTPAAATAGSHGADSVCGDRRRGLASSAASTTFVGCTAPPGTWSLSLSSPADTRALSCMAKCGLRRRGSPRDGGDEGSDRDAVPMSVRLALAREKTKELERQVRPAE